VSEVAGEGMMFEMVGDSGGSVLVVKGAADDETTVAGCRLVGSGSTGGGATKGWCRVAEELVLSGGEGLVLGGRR
jgi:hypothetical protein